MTRTLSSSARMAHVPAYRVEAPRASDAIGLALRRAFDDEAGLPDDMAAMLRAIDGVGQQRSH